MRLRSAVFVLVFSCLAQALPSGRPYKVKESIDTPRGWIKRERVPADRTIELRVAIPQSNFAELERRLYEVSDPTHHSYGAHLSKKEVDELVAPHSDSVNAVHDWLASHGFQKRHLTVSSAGDWVKLALPISQAEKMLDTEYHVWEHRVTGMTAIRTTAYTLPDDLHAHVEFVHPTIAFPSIKPMISGSRFIPDSDTPSAGIKIYSASAAHGTSSWNGTINPACNNEIGLKCLQQIYNFTDYKPSPNSGSRIGITGYLEQFANTQDLQSFFTEQRPDAINTTFDVISVNGRHSEE
ncbi:hypothetical protein QCA50_000951 [Cerrena zonata]|uniref:Peptidase S53 activation domain-containing protein n=1 Tax=Cerrena zonata TaxID=2478898 RepID=A0AAW0GZT8_9APHY